MNEPASVRLPCLKLLIFKINKLQFCSDPCSDPAAQAVAQGFPPSRISPPPNQNAIIFPKSKRAGPSYAGEDILSPPYTIDNAAGSLSDRTVSVSLLRCY